MNTFRYALIRFVPDAERMEPINIGVILQGEGKTDFKLSPHVAKRKDVETQIFQRWRKFFDQEICGPAVPLFQPPKDSPDFITHLGNLCEKTITITPPLIRVISEQTSFEDALESIYDRLVALPEQTKNQPDRPTSQFRRIEEEKGFRKRGMKKYPYIEVPSRKHWNAFRQVLNGANIVIDKIEVGNSVGQTADEIQKLSSGAELFIDDFLNGSSAAYPSRRYCLIADPLLTKFTDQPESDFAIMQQELDGVKKKVRSLGGTVFDQAGDVIGFLNEIDQRLPKVEELS